MYHNLHKLPAEEEEDESVFMTACWQPDNLVFMTARQDLLQGAAKDAVTEEDGQPKGKDRGVEEGGDMTKTDPPDDVDVDGGGGSVERRSPRSSPRAISPVPGIGRVREHTSPISPGERDVQMTLTSSISPSASLEMAITPLSVLTLNGQLQNLVESQEDSITSISSLSSFLDKNPFLKEVCL